MSDSPTVREVSGTIRKDQGADSEWERFHGPRGGEGWKHPATGEVRYQDDPPDKESRGGSGESNGNPSSGTWRLSPDFVRNLDVETRDWDDLDVGNEILFQYTSGDAALGRIAEISDTHLSLDVKNSGKSMVMRNNYDEKVTGVIPHGYEDNPHRDLTIDFTEWSAPPMEDPIKVPEAVSEWDRSDEDAEQWISNNFFAGQHIKLLDATGEPVEKVVQGVNRSKYGIDNPEVQYDRFDSLAVSTLIERNGYQLESVQDPDSLTDEQRIKSGQKQWGSQTNFVNISRDSEDNARMQFQSKVVPTIKDSGVAQRLCNNQVKLSNRVERASCRKIAGRNSYSIKVSESVPLDTTLHEYGHATAMTFNYGYGKPGQRNVSDEKYRRRPTNLSHEFNQLCRYDKIGRFVEFEFSKDSDFYDPEEYMLRDKRHDEYNGENQPERFDEWKPRVEREVESGVGILPNANVPNREYESVGSTSAKEVFDSLEPGDSIAIDVRKKKRDPDTGALIDEIETNREHLKLESMNEDNTSATFERVGGEPWKWMINDDGDLQSTNGSEVVGVCHMDQDDSLDVIDDPAIDPDAETSEEKMQNLISTCNRAWYKMAISSQELSGFDMMNMVVGTGYSMSNAHETMAMLNETMQSPTAWHQVGRMAENHPTLVWAYCEVFTPSDEVLEHHGDVLRMIGCDVPVSEGER